MDKNDDIALYKQKQTHFGVSVQSVFQLLYPDKQFT